MRHRLLVPMVLLALARPVSAQEPAPDLVQGFLPKEDLGVLEFRKQLPDADGRGVIVAVIDTGIDLAHPALQQTSDGKPKVIDFYDATDGGEVDLPVAHTLAQGEDTLAGLTGRRLRLGAYGTVGRVFHQGRIQAKTALPEGLAERVLAAREHERQEQERKDKDRAFGGAAPEEKPAPEPLVYDIVSFQDEQGRWRVLVDTDADGDLGEEKALGEFRETHDVGTFPDPVRLGFAVSILDQGKKAVLLTDGGGHGTHVAGIIGGYYGPDSPLNGLAPGAQFIAIKIGNHRIGGATSHLAMHKAIDYARRVGARVVNCSFGGDSFFCDGREEGARMFDDAVERYGLFICVSAGNNGPALNTVGSPGTARRAFTIGALCSQLTQRTNYGVLDPRRDDLFDFSSRGPLTAGGAGVDFVAPGAALSPLPTWHLKRFESWNGTSMASPQAAGAITVLLSAALQNQLPTSVVHVRRALTRTALPIPGLTPIEQGAGRMQVGPAFEELKRAAAGKAPVGWLVSCRNPTGTGAGVYDRVVTGSEPFDRDVNVRPDFDERTSASVKAEFGGLFRLVAEAEWVEAPAETYVNSGGANLRLRFHPERMAEGLNVARVSGFAIPTEAGTTGEPAGAQAAEFEILCTMIRPVRCAAPDPVYTVQWSFKPGDRRSAFLLVPPGATRARIEARESGADQVPAVYTLAANSVTLWHEAEAVTGRNRCELRKDDEGSFDVAAVPGTTLEVVAFAQWRRGARIDSNLDLVVRFLGIETDTRVVEIPTGRNGAHAHLHAALGPVGAKIEANVDGLLDPLTMTWDVHKDPRHADFFDGETLFEAIGRAPFEARAGEAMGIDLRFDKEFLDLLDDAWFEVRNENGAILKAEHFWTGRMDFTAPYAGRFELAVTIHDRGSLRLQEKGYLAPTLVRRIGPVGLQVFASLHEGFAPGANPGGVGQPIGDLSMTAGERRGVYVRRADLPGVGEFTGTITFTDAKGKGVLLRVPMRLDNRPPGAPTPEAARAIVRDGALKTLRRLARLGAAPDAEVKAGQDARALLAALGAPDLDERVARAGLGLAFNEPPAALEQELSAVIDEGLKDEGNRRDPLARAFGLRADVRRRQAKLPEADQDLGAARARIGDLVGLDEVEYRIRRDQKRLGDAVIAARKAVERDPTLARLRKDLVDAEIAAGNLPRARRIVMEWFDLFPGDVAGFNEVMGKVDGGSK